MALRLVRTDNGGFTFTDPSIGSSNFFISAWIKPNITGIGINGAYFLKAANASGVVGDFTLGVTSAGAGIYILWRSSGSESNNGLLTPVVFTDGNPHHVLVGFDGTNRRIFIDGVDPSPGTTTLAPVLGTEAYAGRLRPTSPDDEYFDGDIQDFAIHIGNWASAQDIAELASGVKPNALTSGKIMDRYWPLSTNLDDLSTNNDDGTLVAGTFVTDFVPDPPIPIAAMIAANASVTATLGTVANGMIPPDKNVAVLVDVNVDVEVKIKITE